MLFFFVLVFSHDEFAKQRIVLTIESWLDLVKQQMTLFWFLNVQVFSCQILSFNQLRLFFFLIFKNWKCSVAIRCLTVLSRSITTQWLYAATYSNLNYFDCKSKKINICSNLLGKSNEQVHQRINETGIRERYASNYVSCVDYCCKIHFYYGTTFLVFFSSYDMESGDNHSYHTSTRKVIFSNPGRLYMSSFSHETSHFHDRHYKKIKLMGLTSLFMPIY